MQANGETDLDCGGSICAGIVKRCDFLQPCESEATGCQSGMCGLKSAAVARSANRTSTPRSAS